MSDKSTFAATHDAVLNHDLFMCLDINNPLNVNLKAKGIDIFNYKVVKTLNIRNELLEIFNKPESQQEQIKNAVKELRDLADELELCRTKK